MKVCPHGMPSPTSCVDCMNEGNLPPKRVEPERRAPDAPRIYSRFETVCPICDNTIFGLDLIVLTTRDRWVHEGCVP